jgi:hypothetical protein
LLSFIYFGAVNPEKGALDLSGCEDVEFREAYLRWAERVAFHQRQIFMETAKIVDLMKQKRVSAKTKNEMAIIVKGLQATVKSISKVVSKQLKQP